MFVALDGNMQLKRRKLKENDVIKYINEDFFSADKYQDKYEDDQDQPSTTDECESNFKATTNASRSNARYHESGLVGSICARHDVPLEFTNIYQSGEKYESSKNRKIISFQSSIIVLLIVIYIIQHNSVL